jgi:hypothetical protein
MTAAKCDDFKWDELVKRIKHKNVIPVIGHDLFRCESESEGEGEFLLYNYLAERVLEACGAILPSDKNHKFAKACFEFLKRNNHYYPELSAFLKKTLEGVHLTQNNALCKLARISSFDIFINTAYDNFLTNMIKTVRSAPTKALSYAKKETYLNLLDNELFNSIKNSNWSLVYHIFGNLDNKYPAFTEKDILEIIMEFHKDMVGDRHNNLFQNLESRSLLFIGCGYDDWLFRFFIRSMTNGSFEFSPQNKVYKIFVGDDFINNKKDPFHDLLRFLREHQVVDFYPCSGRDFVELLFEKLENDDSDDPAEIIKPNDFPGTAFISFEGNDRSTARKLTKNLRADGIPVWLDESKFKGGEYVAQTIINAIDKCPVFIPLISKNSQRIQTDDGKLKYHIREWEWALKNNNKDDNKIMIIPVIIDDANLKDWKYEEFKELFHYKIPGGDKVGDYEKLKNQLIDEQRKN